VSYLIIYAINQIWHIKASSLCPNFPRNYGPRHFGTITEVSGHFGNKIWCRSVLCPKRPVAEYGIILCLISINASLWLWYLVYLLFFVQNCYLYIPFGWVQYFVSLFFYSHSIMFWYHWFSLLLYRVLTTGKISGTVHRELVKEYTAYIRPGTVVVLRQVVII